MHKKIIFLLLFIIPLLGNAQYKKSKYKKANNFSNAKNKARKEYVFGIGACNFLGELGGANQIGTHFVRDFEFSATRPSAMAGMRYKFAKRFGVKGGLYYQLLSGADNLTKEPYRHNRNLSFRSNVFELSGQLEVYLTREQQGHRYKIKNARGMKSYDYQLYLFGGVGAFYFNPQAKYNGRWVNLQPLGTEGQGLPGGKKKYSRVNVCIPYGIGAKYNLNKDWSVGLEVGIRKTFTDYLDDVSTVYYDNAKLRAARGDAAADLADPSLSNYPVELLNGGTTTADQTAAGQQRGQPKYKDAFMFINITASYKVPYKKRTRSKF